MARRWLSAIRIALILLELFAARSVWAKTSQEPEHPLRRTFYNVDLGGVRDAVGAYNSRPGLERGTLVARHFLREGPRAGPRTNALGLRTVLNMRPNVDPSLSVLETATNSLVGALYGPFGSNALSCPASMDLSNAFMSKAFKRPVWIIPKNEIRVGLDACQSDHPVHFFDPQDLKDEEFANEIASSLPLELPQNFVRSWIKNGGKERLGALHGEVSYIGISSSDILCDGIRVPGGLMALVDTNRIARGFSQLQSELRDPFLSDSPRTGPGVEDERSVRGHILVYVGLDRFEEVFAEGLAEVVKMSVPTRNGLSRVRQSIDAASRLKSSLSNAAVCVLAGPDSVWWVAETSRWTEGLFSAFGTFGSGKIGTVAHKRRRPSKGEPSQECEHFSAELLEFTKSSELRLSVHFRMSNANCHGTLVARRSERRSSNGYDFTGLPRQEASRYAEYLRQSESVLVLPGQHLYAGISDDLRCTPSQAAESTSVVSSILLVFGVSKEDGHIAGVDRYATYGTLYASKELQQGRKVLSRMSCRFRDGGFQKEGAKGTSVYAPSPRVLSTSRADAKAASGRVSPIHRHRAYDRSERTPRKSRRSRHTVLTRQHTESLELFEHVQIQDLRAELKRTIDNGFYEYVDPIASAFLEYDPSIWESPGVFGLRTLLASDVSPDSGTTDAHSQFRTLVRDSYSVLSSPSSTCMPSLTVEKAEQVPVGDTALYLVNASDIKIGNESCRSPYQSVLFDMFAVDADFSNAVLEHMQYMDDNSILSQLLRADVALFLAAHVPTVAGILFTPPDLKCGGVEYQFAVHFVLTTHEISNGFAELISDMLPPASPRPAQVVDFAPDSLVTISVSANSLALGQNYVARAAGQHILESFRKASGQAKNHGMEQRAWLRDAIPDASICIGSTVEYAPWMAIHANWIRRVLEASRTFSSPFLEEYYDRKSHGGDENSDKLCDSYQIELLGFETNTNVSLKFNVYSGEFECSGAVSLTRVYSPYSPNFGAIDLDGPAWEAYMEYLRNSSEVLHMPSHVLYFGYDPAARCVHAETQATSDLQVALVLGVVEDDGASPTGLGSQTFGIAHATASADTPFSESLQCRIFEGSVSFFHDHMHQFYVPPPQDVANASSPPSSGDAVENYLCQNSPLHTPDVEESDEDEYENDEHDPAQDFGGAGTSPIEDSVDTSRMVYNIDVTVLSRSIARYAQTVGLVRNESVAENMKQGQVSALESSLFGLGTFLTKSLLFNAQETPLVNSMHSLVAYAYGLLSRKYKYECLESLNLSEMRAASGFKGNVWSIQGRTALVNGASCYARAPMYFVTPYQLEDDETALEVFHRVDSIFSYDAAQSLLDAGLHKVLAKVGSGVILYGFIPSDVWCDGRLKAGGLYALADVAQLQPGLSQIREMFQTGKRESIPFHAGSGAYVAVGLMTSPPIVSIPTEVLDFVRELRDYQDGETAGVEKALDLAVLENMGWDAGLCVMGNDASMDWVYDLTSWASMLVSAANTFRVQPISTNRETPDANEESSKAPICDSFNASLNGLDGHGFLDMTFSVATRGMQCDYEVLLSHIPSPPKGEESDAFGRWPYDEVWQRNATQLPILDVPEASIFRAQRLFQLLRCTDSGNNSVNLDVAELALATVFVNSSTGSLSEEAAVDSTANVSQAGHVPVTVGVVHAYHKETSQWLGCRVIQTPSSEPLAVADGLFVYWADSLLETNQNSTNTTTAPPLTSNFTSTVNSTNGFNFTDVANSTDGFNFTGATTFPTVFNFTSAVNSTSAFNSTTATNSSNPFNSTDASNSTDFSNSTTTTGPTSGVNISDFFSSTTTTIPNDSVGTNATLTTISTTNATIVVVSTNVTTSTSENVATSTSPAPALPSASPASQSPSATSGGGVCFHAGSMVEVLGKGATRMSELQVGDKVRTSMSSFDGVILFTHADAFIMTEFVCMQTWTNHSICTSPGHYVYVGSGRILKAAAAVRVGDELHLAMDGDGRSAVRNIQREWKRGLFNPQTTSGDIVVDGVIASTYTQHVHVGVARAALAPLAVLYDLTGGVVLWLTRAALWLGPSVVDWLPSGPQVFRV